MIDIPDRDEDSPFHRGETAIQSFVGIREKMKTRERFLRNHLTEQHRQFFDDLPYVIIGKRDSQGRPIASILVGNRGFIRSPDARTLAIGARPSLGDPISADFSEGDAIGVLGVDLGNRRRNRLFGTLSDVGAESFSVSVIQSFGNCPSYIQTRNWSMTAGGKGADIIEELNGLDEDAREAIRQADTFFVASSSPPSNDRRYGVDVSHRGGMPGFVSAEGDVLTIPDFPGNFFYNTLGNFLLYPHAGLLFVDFESGDILQLTGDVEIVWKGDEVNSYRGAERLWRVRVRHLWRRRAALSARWAFRQYSPILANTGTWSEASIRLTALRHNEQYRSCLVTRVVDEAENIRSFYFNLGRDGGTFSYAAGQYLPLKVSLDRLSSAEVRHYSLSSAPEDPFMRITVKRQGTVSSHLYQNLSEGGILEVAPPRGRFALDCRTVRPAVMFAGGIGITPIISVIRHAAMATVQAHLRRPVLLFHCCRTSAERPFAGEIRGLQGAFSGALDVVYFVDTPIPGDIEGEDFHNAGPISVDRVKALFPDGDPEFFLCGPAGFMQSLYNGLRAHGIDDDRIFAEAFGPSSIRRSREKRIRETDVSKDGIATVIFAEAGVEADWHPRDGTLLDLAEQVGLNLSYQCRGGDCGTCAVPLIAGEVTHDPGLAATIPEGTVLICSARPSVKNESRKPKIIIDC